MGRWAEPRTFRGEIQSWYYQATAPWHDAGDGRSFMSLHVPSVRDKRPCYVLLITRGEIDGRIEIDASSHEEAKTKAIEAAREYLQALSLAAAEVWKELR